MLLALSALGAMAEPASSKPEFIKINPENVIVFEPNGKFKTHDAPKLLEGDLDLLSQIESTNCEQAPCPVKPVSTDKAALPIEQNRLTFMMTYLGKDSVLLIRNGFSHAVRYKLLISVDGKVDRTDVCEVFKGGRSSEHWPYKIEWMAIGDIQLFERKGESEPTCE